MNPIHKSPSFVDYTTETESGLEILSLADSGVPQHRTANTEPASRHQELLAPVPHEALLPALPAPSRQPASTRAVTPAAPTPALMISDPLLYQSLCCPVSGQLLMNAVILEDGFSYQPGPRLDVYLAKRRSPVTGKPLKSTDFRPNLAMRAICARVAAGERPSLQWDELICPVSGDVLVHPQVDAAGATFSAIGLWEWVWRLGGSLQATSPTTRTPVAIERNGKLEFIIGENLAIQRVIDVLLAKDLPLHCAVLAGRLEGALTGQDLDTQDEQGQTALLLAAKYGHSELVLALLKAGAKPELSDISGKTPLFVAVEHGHHDSTRALAQEPVLHLAHHETGAFPLSLAASLDDALAIGILWRPETCQHEELGRVAVIQAVRNRRYAALAALVELGADTIGRVDGKSAIELAGTPPIDYRAMEIIFKGRL